MKQFSIWTDGSLGLPAHNAWVPDRNVSTRSRANGEHCRANERCDGSLKLDMVRGLPTGYISALEQRLSETEAALYAALRQSRGEPTEQMTCQTTQLNDAMPRSARLAQWKRLPLASSTDMDLWCAERRRQLQEAASSGPGSTAATAATHALLPAQGHRSDDDNDDGFAAGGQYGTGIRAPQPSEDWGTDGTSGATHALSRIAPLDRRKYF